MLLLQSFISGVKKSNLFSPKDNLIIAVSGGVDSVVLCELCKEAGFDFIIAHCNFQLRETESDRDELFVRSLGNRYGVEVLVKRFDTEVYAADNKISIQEAARDLRYGWFNELIENQKSTLRQAPGKNQNFLLTAHHADDNAETMLMNFFRGTGLHGLTGISAAGSSGIFKNVKRPLLNFSKEVLIEFAKEKQLDFVEDSSNSSSKYTRNFFRNELIPAISNVFPQVKENLQNNIKRFTEIEKLYQLSVTELIKKWCRPKANELHIPVKKLIGYNNTALIYEIISQYGFNEKQVDELIKLAESDSGKYIVSANNNYRIIKHRRWFIISPVVAMISENIIIEEADQKIEFTSGRLSIEKTSIVKPSNSIDFACLDLKQITFPLLLRKWKTGDYFYPLGMKKKKKINRFLIDQKLSVADKEKIWVIESCQRIVWIVGLRIDDRFKITTQTKNTLIISYTA